jgi:TRAP-type C4-dicarboxylate transport system substrate-binding protein
MRILAILLALWSLSSAPAAAEIAGRVAVIYPEGQPTVQMWRRFAERVRPAGVNLQVIPGGQLGGEREVAEGMRLGSIQAADNTLASLSAWVSQGQVFDFPYLFRDLGHIERVMAGPIGERFKGLYAAQGFHVLGYIVYGPRNLVSRVPIERPEDLRGRPMRVIQSPLHIALWRALGANPTPIPITEAYGALDTGVVSLMDMTADGFEALRLYEVAPYYIETNHIWSVGAMIVATRFWARLDRDQQQALAAAAADATVFFDALQARFQSEALARAVARGARVIHPDGTLWQSTTRRRLEEENNRLGGMSPTDALVMAITNTP